MNGVWHVVAAECFNEQAPTERGHTCGNELCFMWRAEVPPLTLKDTAVNVVCQLYESEHDGDPQTPHLLLNYSASYFSFNKLLVV